ncbi:uncharacterized protein DNG_03676 [Cephalotrichum gorgonifer]|uniref:Wax synthase domain-containing protein n=1 Tax=Cephalotrichum gorgonifer TaxID=2041049 RepID=A0AAE8STT6_9PEZI|nr:uncharacterized protein DNG_03676 [Cephalotrichum gorgonifer]
MFEQYANISLDIKALENAVRANHTGEFRAAMALGLSKPPVFPYILFGTFFLPGLYLAIPHANRPWLYRLRFAVMALIVSLNIKMMTDTSGANPAMSFGAGLYAYWGIMNCFSALIWKRPQFEAERILRVPARSRSAADMVVVKEKAEESDAVDRVECDGNSQITPKLISSDGAGDWRGDSTTGILDDLAKTVPRAPEIMLGQEGYEYYWEPFPADAPFSHRFNWAMDLVTNLRGEGWNFAVPTIPHPTLPETPGSGERAKLESIPKTAQAGYSRCNTTKEYLVRRIGSLALAYILLDAISTLMVMDPFFILGTTDWPLPPYLAVVPGPVLYTGRSLLVLFAVYAFVFLVLAYIDLIQFFIGGYFFPVRREPWCHCSIFGSTTEVLDRGLAGFWGGWWHQTFRVPFTAPVIWLVGRGYLPRRSKAARYAGYLSAFLNSALLHGSGSYTAVPPTKLHRLPLFFGLSAIGVLFQQAVCHACGDALDRLPRTVRRAGNLLFVAFWLQLTCWPLAAEFASAGVFILEPVPVSIFRGLGFGSEADGN